MIQSRFGHFSLLLMMALLTTRGVETKAEDNESNMATESKDEDLDLLGDGEQEKAGGAGDKIEVQKNKDGTKDGNNDGEEKSVKAEKDETEEKKGTAENKSSELNQKSAVAISVPAGQKSEQASLDMGFDSVDDAMPGDCDDDNQKKRKSYAFFGTGIGAGGMRLKPINISTNNQAPEQLTIPAGYSNANSKIANPNAGNKGMPFALNTGKDAIVESSYVLPIRFGYRAYMGDSPFFAGFQAGVTWCNFQANVPLSLDYTTYDITKPAATGSPLVAAAITNQKKQTASITANLYNRFNMDVRFVAGGTIGDRMSVYGSIGWAGNRIVTTVGNYSAAPGERILSNPQGSEKIVENKFASGAVGAVGVDYSMGTILVGIEGFSIFGISKELKIYQYNNVSNSAFMGPYVDTCNGEPQTTIWGAMLTVSFKFEDL